MLHQREESRKKSELLVSSKKESECIEEKENFSRPKRLRHRIK